MTKKGHGGKREGAGRKAAIVKVSKTYYLPIDMIKSIEQEAAERNVTPSIVVEERLNR